MKKIIKKAIEGGYDFKGNINSVGLGDGKWGIDTLSPGTIVISRKEVTIDYAEIVKYKMDISTILLDPKFWQTLGKAEGWRSEYYSSEDADIIMEPWRVQWHQFIDHLAEGKPAEEFFAGLLR